MLVMVVSAFLLMAGNYLGTMLNDFLAPMLGHTPVNNLEEYMASVPLAYVFLTTVILAPITEEWIFRRGVLGRLLPLGQMPAVFLSALLFALFHGNLYQFFYAFFMGILLGFLYLETGSCRSSIGLHMAVNLCFGVIPTALYQHSGMIMAAFWQMFLLAVGAIGLVSFVYGRIRGTIFLWKRDAETMEGWCGLAFLNPGMILSMGACLVLLALNLFWS